MMKYTEPDYLHEPDEKPSGRKLYESVIALAVIMILGVFISFALAKLPPTFNGNVDVSALQKDPKAYNLDKADGIASVLVSENLDLTNALNSCFSVVFNFRGYDTMGESFILIAALCGSLVILRNPKHKTKASTESDISGKASLNAAPDNDGKEKQA